MDLLGFFLFWLVVFERVLRIMKLMRNQNINHKHSTKRSPSEYAALRASFLMNYSGVLIFLTYPKSCPY